MEGQSKKANSAYKWVKENWKKLFVSIVAIFALIVVVEIYIQGKLKSFNYRYTKIQEETLIKVPT